jgi:N-acetyl sugar amidotransferase
MNEKINKYQMCSRCIMDTKDDPDIVFDLKGVCNHCVTYDRVAKERLSWGEQRASKLASLLEEVKASGRDNDYDCVVGASGGVDSTYVALLAKGFGLRALVVHCDNGWNSELAVKNIENIVKKLDFDLFTYVINWEEFKDLQMSYLKASVVDIEALTDHAITASLFQVAARHRIKYILSGDNMVTEGVLPARWVHNKNDLINIKAIHRQFGRLPLKTFPTLGLTKKLYYQKVRSIRFVPILNYVDFVKEDAKSIITEELGWRDYGGKHYESIFTRFYQSYILPVKFHIDKRKSHLSTLICSGQMTREQALERIQEDPIDADTLYADKEYIIKKFGLTAASFDDLMLLPVKQHTEYASMLNIYRRLRPVAKFAIQFRRRRLGTAEH